MRIFIKLEISLPNEQGRLDILKIHAAPIAKRGDIGKFKIILSSYEHFLSYDF